MVHVFNILGDAKSVFSQEREWFEEDTNVEQKKKAKSSIRILGSKSSPNMRGRSSIVCGSRF